MLCRACGLDHPPLMGCEKAKRYVALISRVIPKQAWESKPLKFWRVVKTFTRNGVEYVEIVADHNELRQNQAVA